MSIRQWPEAERPREKLLKRGASALSDAELLAIFLRTGLPGLTAVELARKLLTEFGSLRQLLNASETEFCAQKGLGRAKYVQMQAILEISRRHLAEGLERGDCLNSPKQTANYLRAMLRDLPHEQFVCLMLDNRHRVIETRVLFRGTINGASVHPREVVKQALADNAAAVILAHNHPSGIAEPSQADIQITHRLRDALALVDIRVLDHVIVGDEVQCLSESGLI